MQGDGVGSSAQVGGIQEIVSESMNWGGRIHSITEWWTATTGIDILGKFSAEKNVLTRGLCLTKLPQLRSCIFQAPGSPRGRPLGKPMTAHYSS